ncbi:phosphate transport system protein [Sinobacterium caligoides]|uniref:Phosphate-specific transport system accessory protein PhoU n=1 Tax=Sinobacterium caligoides TaxID=933926 RepID=A0A3N2DZY0_9GAMM|nr:phosphate signaling complex protein PhoU [Sinobacterium caligoides]ROS05337.1 phosphate transport system protein [Sinobacterium caligoides]
MTLNKHIYTQYDTELTVLKGDLFEMAQLVGRQLVTAVAALAQNDQAMAREVRENERNIDSLELKIDEGCAHILVARQPAARDLRRILATSRIAGDLERAGDEANKIAKIVEKLTARNEVFNDGRLMKLANDVQMMIEQAMQAFSHVDVGLAVEVIRSDKQIDKAYGEGLRDVIEIMRAEAERIDSAMDIVWALRSIERAGDHAVNIAEQVVYYALGKDVRHVSVDDLPAEIGC